MYHDGGDSLVQHLNAPSFGGAGNVIAEIGHYMFLASRECLALRVFWEVNR